MEGQRQALRLSSQLGTLPNSRRRRGDGFFSGHADILNQFLNFFFEDVS